MGTNVTSSLRSVLEEPEIQKLQMQAKIFKENSLNKLNALKSTTQLLDRQKTLLNAETLHEMDSKSALSVIKKLESTYQLHGKNSGGSHLRPSSTSQPLEQKDDGNVTPDSSNICTNDNQVDQNVAECVDERVALANLIANLTLDTEENKTILKQLKKANASLTQELKECKTNLDEIVGL
ncbi:hypothetical protein Tco_1376130 [Tanacetum coccineum]